MLTSIKKNNPLKINKEIIFNGCVFLFPILIHLLKGWGDLILLVLAITGITHFFQNGLANVNGKEFKLFCLATLGYYLWLIISVLFSGQAAYLFHYLDRDLHFLLAPFILLACATTKINLKLLFLGIKLGLILTGSVIFYQYMNGHGRPSANINAGHFGNMVIMSVFILLAYSLAFPKRIDILSYLAIGMGIFSVTASLSRAAWLSGILMAAVLIIFAFFHFKINRKVFAVVIISLCTCLAIIGSTSEKVENRINTTINALTNWKTAENKATSSGYRLEMYKGSILGAKDIPLTGYGYRHEEITNFVAIHTDNSVRPKIESFMQLHSAYFNHLYYGGIIGLLSIIFLVLFPIKQFYQSLQEQETQIFGLAGILLCFGYATFGVLNNVFGDVLMNAFFVFYISIFYGQTMKYKSIKKA